MKPDVEKIVAVWEKEPGLCRGLLVDIGPLGQREAGCAVGSLLWATGAYRTADELEDLDGNLSGEEDEARSLLAEHFGMTPRDASALMNWNDAFRLSAWSPLPYEAAARRDYMIQKVREEWGDSADASPAPPRNVSVGKTA